MSIKAKLKVFPTNIDLVVGDNHININIDFQDSAFFNDDTEAYEWINYTLNEQGVEIDNREEIVEQIRSAIDIYVA